MKARTNNNKIKQTNARITADRDSLLGAATHHRLEGPRFAPRWWGEARIVQTRPGAHPASSIVANEALSLQQSGRGVAMTNHYHLASSLSHTSAPPLCPYGLLHGNLYLYITFSITHGGIKRSLF
jgi:hypothetical protein